MEGGRKPKRRIIDSTSVPISRRTSQKQQQVQPTTKQSTDETLAEMADVSPKSSSGVNEITNDTKHDNLTSLSDQIHVESDERETGVCETTLKQAEVLLTLDKCKERDESNKPNSWDERNIEENENAIENNKVLEMDNKLFSRDTMVCTETMVKSEHGDAPRGEFAKEDLSTFSKIDKTSVVEFNSMINPDADKRAANDGRSNETNEDKGLIKSFKVDKNEHKPCDDSRQGSKKMDVLTDGVNETNVNIKYSTSNDEVKEKKNDPHILGARMVMTGAFPRLPEEMCVAPVECDRLNYSDIVEKIDKLFGTNEAPGKDMEEGSDNKVDEQEQTVNEAPATDLVDGSVGKNEEPSRNLNESDFFGDGEVPSYIRKDSADESDLNGNVVCTHGLSLFDEPKAVENYGSKFQFDLPPPNYGKDITAKIDTNYISPGDKDPFSIELELTTPLQAFENQISMADLYKAAVNVEEEVFIPGVTADDKVSVDEDVYSSIMDGSGGTPRLLSVEEKWQIIFNEKTRAPIYAVAQYVEYLSQFVNGRNTASRDSNDVIKKESIHPISYLLRKLKLDLKMSYDSFVEEFIKPENKGMTLLVKLLKSIQNTGSQQSGSANMTQLKNYKKTLTDEHDCLLCIKYSLKLQKSLTVLFDVNYGLETVAMGVISTYTKSRGTAIEILTICLSAEEGFSRTLDCFTYIQLKIGEPVRFKSLVNMMNMDSQHNTIFKVCTMKFLNSLLDASSNTNKRVFLQHELETAGLDVDYMQQKATGTGLEYDDLREELMEWKRKYVNVDTILSQRETITHRSLEPTQQQQLIEDLQTQLEKMSSDKAYLEYQLEAVSTELRSRYEELLKRTPIKQNACTQCDQDTFVRSVGCQCEPVVDIDTENSDPLRNAADYFGWKDVYTERTHNAYCVTYERAHSANNRPADDTEENAEISTSDDEGVVKVQHWLRSHCGSSESETKLLQEGPSSECSTFYFKRGSLTRKTVKKAEFPGNWKLIPKSIEQFPSRFPPQQCHQTNCDRCDLRNRPENSGYKPTSRMQNFALEVRLNNLVKNRRRSDMRSQSSDSAIGGSGEDRTWTDRQIPMVPIVPSEEEILQDLIQPDDSASACPTSEPYPDYSVLDSKFGTQRSLRSELSQVLKEFEGNLLEYELPAKTQTATETFITLGDI